MKHLFNNIYPLIFIVLGMLLKLFDIKNIEFIWIITLILLIYYQAIQISIGEYHHHVEQGLKLLFMSFAVNMIFMSMALHYILGIRDIMLCLFFSAVVSGIASNPHKILGYEAVWSPLISLLFPVLLLEVMSLDAFSLFNPIVFLKPVFQCVLIGIGTGLLIGILCSWFGKKNDISRTYPFIAIGLYFFTEFLQGNGIFSVFVFGFFLANVKIKKHPFNPFKAIDAILFTIAGYLLFFQKTKESLILFLFFLILRFIAVEFGFFKEKISEKLDLTLLKRKGSSAVAMALLLGTYIVKGKIILEYQSGIVIEMIILFVLYSNILSLIYDSSRRSSSRKAPILEP